MEGTSARDGGWQGPSDRLASCELSSPRRPLPHTHTHTHPEINRSPSSSLQTQRTALMTSKMRGLIGQAIPRLSPWRFPCEPLGYAAFPPGSHGCRSREHGTLETTLSRVSPTAPQKEHAWAVFWNPSNALTSLESVANTQT